MRWALFYNYSQTEAQRGKESLLKVTWFVRSEVRIWTQVELTLALRIKWLNTSAFHCVWVLFTKASCVCVCFIISNLTGVK